MNDDRINRRIKKGQHLRPRRKTAGDKRRPIRPETTITVIFPQPLILYASFDRTVADTRHESGT